MTKAQSSVPSGAGSWEPAPLQPALPTRAPLGASVPHYGGRGAGGTVDAARDLTIGGWRLAAGREPRPAAPPGEAVRGGSPSLPQAENLIPGASLTPCRDPPAPTLSLGPCLLHPAQLSLPAGGRPPGLVGSRVGGGWGFPPGSLCPGDKAGERGASPCALAGTQLSLR